MAPMPPKTAKIPPTPAAGAAAGADATGDIGADDSQDDGDDTDSGTVLLTVTKMPDGTYQLVQGDEDEGDEGDAGEGADDTGAAAAAGGDTSDTDTDAGAEDEPQPQSFDSKGALMKGILDILNEDEAGSSGSAQRNFDAGFSGDSSATPKQ